MPAKTRTGPHRGGALNQRDRLLDAARAVFARKGLSATMDDIADEANVSHGLAYRYFPSKQALYQEIVINILDAAGDSFREFDAASTPAPNRLRSLVERLVESRCAHPEIYLLLDQVRISQATPKKLLERLRLQQKTVLSAIRSLVIQGQTEGWVSPGDPDQMVWTLGALLEGITRVGFHEPDALARHCPDAEIILRIFMPVRRGN